MREQPHEHRCEQNFANYPKYDFDSCFNWLRDWLSGQQARASVITSRLQSGHLLIIAANFGAPQRNDKLMF